jgi:hypothetical protein
VVEVEVVRKRGVSLSKAAHLIEMGSQKEHSRITLEERLHLIQVLPYTTWKPSPKKSDDTAQAPEGVHLGHPPHTPSCQPNYQNGLRSRLGTAKPDQATIKTEPTIKTFIVV